MPYQIDRFNGVPLTTVDDGTIDQTTDLKFVGKNYAGYGEIQNENFLFLLENFSNTVAPSKPISGQIWYDSATKKLKFYDNTKWRTTGGAEISASAPTGLTTGDFWWDTSSKQLYAWDGAAFVLVGPQAVEGSGQTNLESVSVIDTLSNTHAIVKAIVDGVVTFIISSDTFTLDSGINPITGFSVINQGITLVNSPTGISTTSFRFFGTATDSDRLGGIAAANYLQAVNASFTGLAEFDDTGFTVGNDSDLRVSVVSGTVPTIANQVSGRISFRILDGVTNREPLRIDGTTVVPGTNLTFDLGSTSLRWNNGYINTIFADTVNANNFVGTISGTAAQADTLLFNADYRSASANNVGNTIVARDPSGSFAANVVTATATSARYADLAERYESDADYEPGTVVVFGGIKEITVSNKMADPRVAGVVSTAPAYLMNSESDGLPIALRGKVPVKVIGKVSKGDCLITSGSHGYAKVADPAIVTPIAIFAKAIEDKDDFEPGVVMAVII